MKEEQNKEEKTILCVDNDGIAIEYVSNFKVNGGYTSIIRYDGLGICNVPPLEEIYEQKNKRKLAAILKKYWSKREQGYYYMAEDWNLYKKID